MTPSWDDEEDQSWCYRPGEVDIDQRRIGELRQLCLEVDFSALAVEAIDPVQSELSAAHRVRQLAVDVVPAGVSSQKSHDDFLVTDVFLIDQPTHQYRQLGFVDGCRKARKSGGVLPEYLDKGL